MYYNVKSILKVGRSIYYTVPGHLVLCFFFFFLSLCGKSMTIISHLPIQYFILHPSSLTIFSLLTTSISKILVKLSAAVSFLPNDSDMK